MKPAAFAYIRPTTLPEALAALHRRPEARVLAGGQSLLAMLNMRLARPQLIVDIGSLQDLRSITRSGGKIVIGAGVTQADALTHPLIRDQVPLLWRSLPSVGHYQTRSRGTVCGSIAHADPAAELPLVLAVLGGAVMLRARRGHRVVPASAFFRDMLVTAIRPGEMVVATQWPVKKANTGYAFEEFALRHGDFAIVAAAARVQVDSQGRVVSAGLGLGGVAGRPVVIDCSRMLQAQDESAIAGLAQGAVQNGDDLHASRAYRQELAAVLAAKVMKAALADARQAPHG